MKRLFAFILVSSVLLLAAPSAHSQQVMKNSIDSLLNATTGYAVQQIQQPVDVITINFVLTKSTGTVAGRALPQGSIDGITYTDISTDTLKFNDVSINAKSWSFDKARYKYYRTAATTTGTQKSYPVSKIFTRQPPK